MSVGDRPGPSRDGPPTPHVAAVERRADVPVAPLGEVLGPLPVWAAAAVVGAWSGGRSVDLAVPSVVGAAAVAAAMAGLLALGWWVRVRSTSQVASSPSVGVLAAVVVVAVVAGGVLLRGDTRDRGALPRLADLGGTAVLEVRVVHEPRPIATGWHVLLQVESVDGAPTRERAAATVEGEPPVLGTRWRATASARPLPDVGYGRWLAQQHAVVLLDLGRTERIGDPGWIAATSEHVRARVRDAATRHLDDRAAGLLVGFVTGDTRLLPPDDEEAMRLTGLSHLTAVSGANVAIVLAGVAGLTVLVRLGARGRRRTLTVAVVWFALVTRFEPSVLRAGTMALVVLLAGARGVARDARHALAGAVLLLVLVDPLLATSLGLLLSATATAGVLVIAPLVRARLPPWLPRRVAELLALTIGAQVAVVPLLLTSFGQVPLASVPANLIAVPFAALSSAIAFIGAALAAAVHVAPGAALLWVAAWPARVVLWAASAFADTGGQVELARPSTVTALVAACVWMVAHPRGRVARGAAVVLAGALVVTAVPMVVGAREPATFVVTAIDVGQGDAFLVEAPGARLLIDAGEGEAAATWLRANGRRRLDLVVVTHPHLDHIGGVSEVLRQVTVDAVWLRPVPADNHGVREALEVAAGHGVPVRTPRLGEQARIGALDVEVVHPPPGRPYRWSNSEPNDTSLVVRVHHGGRRALFPGDIEAPAQADLIATSPHQLVAELLAVPHHGSRTTDPAFLAAVSPRAAIISVGADNRYGHPAPEIVRALTDSGVVIHRTDIDGTVRVPVPAPRHAPVSALDAEPDLAPVSASDAEPGLAPVSASDAEPDLAPVAQPGPGPVEGAAPGPVTGAEPVTGSRYAPRYDPRAAARRRRRPPAAPRARTSARATACRGPGARGRAARRAGDRAPAGAAHHLAVRGADLRRVARLRGALR